MPERKPMGISWQSWVDQPHDEMWWLKEELRREDVDFLPPALAVRGELEDALDRIAKAKTDSTVRQIAAVINERIVQVNSRTTSGPPSSLMPLDLDRVLLEWRKRVR